MSRVLRHQRLGRDRHSQFPRVDEQHLIAAVMRYEEPGLPLGLSDLVDEQRRVHDLKVAGGGRLLTCTDGVSEARDSAGDCYPVAARLRHRPHLPTDRMPALLRADPGGAQSG